jgi:hypothetical protein
MMERIMIAATETTMLFFFFGETLAYLGWAGGVLGLIEEGYLPAPCIQSRDDRLHGGVNTERYSVCCSTGADEIDVPPYGVCDVQYEVINVAQG